MKKLYSVLLCIAAMMVLLSATAVAEQANTAGSVTVTFETIHGGNVESAGLAAGDALDMDTIAKPQRPGYSFMGWFMDEGLVTPYTGQPFESDATLYAGYTPESMAGISSIEDMPTTANFLLYSVVELTDDNFEEYVGFEDTRNNGTAIDFELVESREEYMLSAVTLSADATAQPSAQPVETAAIATPEPEISPESEAAYDAEIADEELKQIVIGAQGTVYYYRIYAPDGFATGGTYALAALQPQNAFFVAADGEDITGSNNTEYAFSIKDVRITNVVEKGDIARIAKNDCNIVAENNDGSSTATFAEGTALEAGQIVFIEDGTGIGDGGDYYKIISVTTGDSGSIAQIQPADPDDVWSEYEYYFDTNDINGFTLNTDEEAVKQEVLEQIESSEGYIAYVNATLDALRRTPAMQEKMDTLTDDELANFMALSAADLGLYTASQREAQERMEAAAFIQQLNYSRDSGFTQMSLAEDGEPADLVYRWQDGELVELDDGYTPMKIAGSFKIGRGSVSFSLDYKGEDDYKFVYMDIKYDSGNYNIKIGSKIEVTLNFTISQKVDMFINGGIIKQSDTLPSMTEDWYESSITPDSTTKLTFSAVMEMVGDDSAQPTTSLDLTKQIEEEMSSNADSYNLWQYVEALKKESDESKDMYDSDISYVKIAEVPLGSVQFSVTGIESVGVEVSLVISMGAKVSLSASVECNYRMEFYWTNGKRVFDKDFNVVDIISYEKEVYGYRMLNESIDVNFALKGTIGIRAGIRVTITFSAFQLNKLASVGASIEVGAYVKLMGYISYHYKHYNTNNYYMGELVSSRTGTTSEFRGGIKLEMGIYAAFTCECTFIKTWEFTLVDIDIKLWEKEIAAFGSGNSSVYGNFMDTQEDIVLRGNSFNLAAPGSAANYELTNKVRSTGSDSLYALESQYSGRSSGLGVLKGNVINASVALDDAAAGAYSLTLSNASYDLCKRNYIGDQQTVAGDASRFVTIKGSVITIAENAPRMTFTVTAVDKDTVNVFTDSYPVKTFNFTYIPAGMDENAQYNINYYDTDGNKVLVDTYLAGDMAMLPYSGPFLNSLSYFNTEWDYASVSWGTEPVAYGGGETITAEDIGLVTQDWDLYLQLTPLSSAIIWDVEVNDPEGGYSFTYTVNTTYTAGGDIVYPDTDTNVYSHVSLDGTYRVTAGGWEDSADRYMTFVSRATGEKISRILLNAHGRAGAVTYEPVTNVVRFYYGKSLLKRMEVESGKVPVISGGLKTNMNDLKIVDWWYGKDMPSDVNSDTIANKKYERVGLRATAGYGYIDYTAIPEYARNVQYIACELNDDGTYRELISLGSGYISYAAAHSGIGLPENIEYIAPYYNTSNDETIKYKVYKFNSWHLPDDMDAFHDGRAGGEFADVNVNKNHYPIAATYDEAGMIQKATLIFDGAGTQVSFEEEYAEKNSVTYEKTADDVLTVSMYTGKYGDVSLFNNYDKFSTPNALLDAATFGDVGSYVWQSEELVNGSYVILEPGYINNYSLADITLPESGTLTFHPASSKRMLTVILRREGSADMKLDFVSNEPGQTLTVEDIMARLDENTKDKIVHSLIAEGKLPYTFGCKDTGTVQKLQDELVLEYNGWGDLTLYKRFGTFSNGENQLMIRGISGGNVVAEDYMLPVAPDETFDGGIRKYVLLGWSKDNDATEGRPLSEFTYDNGSLMAVQRIDVYYNVIYRSGDKGTFDGTGTDQLINGLALNGNLLSDVPVPTVTDEFYEFDKWVLTGDMTTEVDPLTYVANGAVDITAVYKPLSDDITYTTATGSKLVYGDAKGMSLKVEVNLGQPVGDAIPKLYCIDNSGSEMLYTGDIICTIKTAGAEAPVAIKYADIARLTLNGDAEITLDITTSNITLHANGALFDDGKSTKTITGPMGTHPQNSSEYSSLGFTRSGSSSYTDYSLGGWSSDDGRQANSIADFTFGALDSDLYAWYYSSTSYRVTFTAAEGYEFSGARTSVSDYYSSGTGFSSVSIPALYKKEDSAESTPVARSKFGIGTKWYNATEFGNIKISDTLTVNVTEDTSNIVTVKFNLDFGYTDATFEGKDANVRVIEVSGAEGTTITDVIPAAVLTNYAGGLYWTYGDNTIYKANFVGWAIADDTQVEITYKDANQYTYEQNLVLYPCFDQEAAGYVVTVYGEIIMKTGTGIAFSGNYDATPEPESAYTYKSDECKIVVLNDASGNPGKIKKNQLPQNLYHFEDGGNKGELGYSDVLIAINKIVHPDNAPISLADLLDKQITEPIDVTIYLNTGEDTNPSLAGRKSAQQTAKPTATPAPAATPKPEPTATPKPEPTATPRPVPTEMPLPDDEEIIEITSITEAGD